MLWYLVLFREKEISFYKFLFLYFFWVSTLFVDLLFFVKLLTSVGDALSSSVFSQSLLNYIVGKICHLNIFLNLLFMNNCSGKSLLMTSILFYFILLLLRCCHLKWKEFRVSQAWLMKILSSSEFVLFLRIIRCCFVWAHPSSHLTSFHDQTSTNTAKLQLSCWRNHNALFEINRTIITYLD